MFVATSGRLVHITGPAQSIYMDTPAMDEYELSNQHICPGECCLHPEVVCWILGKFGWVQVDLFIDVKLTRYQVWFSLTELNSPLGQDAPTHNVLYCLLYTYLPLLPLLLSRVDGMPWQFPP